MSESQNILNAATFELDSNIAAKPLSQPLGGRVKRVFDVGAAATALVVLFPFMLLLAAGVRLTSRGPALFGHQRVGFAGEKFQCLKFRSMRADADTVFQRLLQSDPEAREEWERTHKLVNDPRVTRFGSFLRRTSLDELPQLVNVLRGHMSLVGPRPVTECELRKYGEDVGAYLMARPGITGLWQVSGRSSASYEQRVAFDRAYAGSWRLSSDMKIMAKTVGVVLKRRGAV